MTRRGKNMRYDYDLLIVGGGPGGYVAALYAARNGLSVALIEKDRELGGTCLNRGCIPMKTLIHSASLWREFQTPDRWGVSAQGVSFDFSAMQTNKEKVVAELTGNVRMLLDKRGVSILAGRGVVAAAHTVTIHSGSEVRIVLARHVIIATGSVPSRVPIPGVALSGVINSDQALSLTQVPKSLVIVGGGVIGVELGWFYRSLGCTVDIVEALPRLIDRSDEAVSDGLAKSLKKDGIGVTTSARVEAIEETPFGLCTRIDAGGQQKGIDSDKVLIAVGRSPVLDVAPDLPLRLQRGFVQVDERMQTGVEDLYAIGDVTGKSMLAHVASHQGIVVVDNILGMNSRMRYDAVPSCIYTQPEAAGVGLTEREARQQFGDVRIGSFPFAGIGKAHSIGNTTGFVKIIAEPKYNRVVGAHILGPSATELIAELALAIEMECTAEELGHTIHAHPTLSESVMEASLDLLGFPINKF